MGGSFPWGVKHGQGMTLTPHSQLVSRSRTKTCLHGVQQKSFTFYWPVRMKPIALGGLVVACLPLDPRFADSNLAEDDGFLRAIKIHSTTSFRKEWKPSVPCPMLQGWKRYFVGKIQWPLLGQLSAASLFVSSGSCQRPLVDESRMIRNQMGMRNR
jgi:hypothetical protein